MNFQELKILDYGYNFPLQPPTKCEIEEFERQIGGKLPTIYVALLKFKNGGNPGRSIVIPEETREGPFLILEVYFSLNGNRQYQFNVWRYYDALATSMPPQTFPFGYDQGGGLFFLQISDDSARVWYGTTDDGFSKMILVNKSFEEFLNSLMPISSLPEISDKYEIGPAGLPRLK